MALNFNTSPYFDDFDPTDNYHRILFKPGRAIQARELSQSQTILQNQISEFASAIYSQNTPISGGKITTNLNCDYIKLNRTLYGADIDISELVGKIITNSTGIISATIIAVSFDSSVVDSSSVSDPPTLILSYRSGQKFSEDSEESVYIQNIDIESGKLLPLKEIAKLLSTENNIKTTGKASVVSISHGVFYVVNGYNKAKNNIRYSIGNFVNVLPQTIILDKYSNTPTVRVGLDIEESIVNSSYDSTLLDPALGASNYQAPGADRYKISLNLITKPFQIGDDSSFIELLRIEKGTIIKQVDHTVYSTIDNYFAKRDFEANGNYIVDDFKLSTKTNIDNNKDKYDLNISKGIAYVQGYRIENQSNLRITSDRARTTKTVLEDITYINFGNYFTVDNVYGDFDFTKMAIVDLHCVPHADITTTTTTTYNSTKIGSAYIRNMDYQTGTGVAVTASFTGSISTPISPLTGPGVLTVTGGVIGSIEVGMILSGLGVTNGIIITSFGTGTGGIGTYNTNQLADTSSTSITGSLYNTDNHIFNSYVSIINTTTLSGKAAAAGSTTNITIATEANDAGKFSVVTNAYYGCVIQITAGTAKGEKRIITGYTPATGSEPKKITVDSPFNIAPDGTTEFKIIFSTGATESIVRPEIVQYTTEHLLKAKANINTGSGKNNSVKTGNAILHKSGNPEMIYELGNSYVSEVANTQYFSTQIFRNLSFSTDGDLTINTSNAIKFQGNDGSDYYGTSFNQLFTVTEVSTGNILLFPDESKKVQILTEGHTAKFVAQAYQGKQVNISAAVNIFNADDSKILKKKELTIGNVSIIQDLSNPHSILGRKFSLTNTGNPTGQVLIQKENVRSFSLYVTDVKRITKIIDIPIAAGAGTSLVSPAVGQSLSNYTDITDKFYFDDGQEDTHYGHSSINLLPGVSGPTGNILVVFDYYLHTGGDGYFSIGSYLNSALPEDSLTTIPSYTASSGKVYKLGDCIDFRPCFKNVKKPEGNWEFSTAGVSTGSTQGVLIPNDLSNFQSDYNFYLGRKDKLVITKDGNFKIIGGIPARIPILPTEPNDSMVLANLILDPYTKYVSGEGPLSNNGLLDMTVPSNIDINKILHKRWTKSDITDLQEQVTNLEYYTSLSLMEHKANSLQVPDTNGLNRFKNGILVDSFVDYGVADTSNTDFVCNLNIREQKLTPLQVVDNFKLHNTGVLNSYGTSFNYTGFAGFKTLTSNLFTLPFTKQALIKQTLASNTISVNPFNVVLYEGHAYLNPQMDNWINTNQPPDINITHPNFQFNQVGGGLNIINGGDWKALTGTETVRTSPIGYINQDGITKNTSVSPYIRSQEIIVRATGLLENTPISCFFDGKKVDEHMTHVNTIELKNVVGPGLFKDDDIIGFYDTGLSKFWPIARVVSVTYVPGDNTKVILSIAHHLIYPPATVATTTVRNANFDKDGNYIGSSASGELKSETGIQSLHNNGTVTAVGGTWTDKVQQTPTFIFKSPFINGATSFLNTYGVWGDQNYNIAYSATYKFKVVTAGIYKLTGSHNGTVGTISIDGTERITGLNTATKTQEIVLSIGEHSVSWVTTKTDLKTIGAVAITIEKNDIGLLIWDSNDPNDLEYMSVGTNEPNLTKTSLIGGGAYYSDVTKISLDSVANAKENSAYVGTKITFKTTYIYQFKYGALYIPPKPIEPGLAPLVPVKPIWSDQKGKGDATKRTAWDDKLRAYNVEANKWNTDYEVYKTSLNVFNTAYNASEASTKAVTHLSLTKSYEGLIIDYDASTRTITLDRPINISIGFNQLEKINISSTYSMSGIQLSTADAIIEGKEISKLSTSSDGKFVALFNVPGSRFNTGSKIFRIDNRLTPTEANSATTFAEATFLAGNSYNNLNYGTPSFDSSSKPFNKFNIVNTGNSSEYDPVAQTFTVDSKSYPNGVFIKSVKIFFAGKDINKDISISIVGTVNGFPSGNILDNSKVSLHPNQVKTSTTPHYLDSDTYTEFEFIAPVYLKQDTLYAILIHSSSSKYVIWMAKQNQVAVPSTTSLFPRGQVVGIPKIGATPYCGALFESQQGLSWTADLTSDIMFVVDQCVFDISIPRELDFVIPRGLPTGTLGTKDILYGIDPLLASGLPGCNFQNSKSTDAINITTTDFIPSPCKIQYQYSATLMSDKSKTPRVSVSPGRYGCPTTEDIHLDDGLGQRVLLENSDDSFQLFTTLSSTDQNVSPIISDDGLSVYNIVYFINNLGITTDKLNIISGGTGYSKITPTNLDGTKIEISNPDVGSDKAILDFDILAGSINSVKIIYPGSGYVKTPTITITDAATRTGNTNASIVVHGETSPFAGNGFAKYITKAVTLTPDNDSGDLRVYCTAYKPLGTEIYVYYKISNSADSSKFTQQNWQLMTQISTSVFSLDRTKLIEYEWAPGVDNNADNNISYISTNGETYNSFITFAIKIVMTTNDNTKVPFIKDIRALALPSGTGI